MMPKLVCKTQRKQKESYNKQAVCITDDSFIQQIEKEKGRGKGEKRRKKERKGRREIKKASGKAEERYPEEEADKEEQLKKAC